MARFFEQKLNFSLFYQILIEKRFTKTKEATFSQIFYPFGTIGAQHWPSKSKVPLPQYKMKQIGRLLRQSLLDWKMEKMKET
jgi:hypothetical protein